MKRSQKYTALWSSPIFPFLGWFKQDDFNDKYKYVLSCGALAFITDFHVIIFIRQKINIIFNSVSYLYIFLLCCENYINQCSVCRWVVSHVSCINWQYITLFIYNFTWKGHSVVTFTLIIGLSNLCISCLICTSYYHEKVEWLIKDNDRWLDHKHYQKLKYTLAIFVNFNAKKYILPYFDNYLE